MSLGCGASFAKVVLVVVNTIFLLLGLGIGIAGLVFRFGTDILQDKIKEALKELKVEVVGGIDIYQLTSSLSLLLIIVGFFIFIVGALGCCGACCSNRVLLVLYAIIVSLLLIAQIVGVALFAGFKSSFDDTFKKSFKSALNSTYGTGATASQDVKDSFNALFETYECCGVDSADDMPKPSLPDQCCIKGTLANTCTKSSGTALRQGCYAKLESQIAQYNKVFIGVGVSILVFQLLCVIFAFCLCAAIGRDSVV